jgi:putative hemolysin
MVAAAWAEWLPWAAGSVVALALCALYCGMETGVYVLNKIRLDLRADAGDRRARRLQRMLGNPNNLLAVLLIGTNIAAYSVTSAIAAMFVLAGLEARAEWYTLLVGTPLLFILGDSVPKNVFRRLAERLMYRLSGLLAASNVLFHATGLSPLVRAAGWALTRLVHRPGPQLAEERLAALFAEGRASGVLTHLQTVMADRVMRIGDVTLADAMVPMDRAAWVRRDVTRGQLLEVVQSHSYSRLPVRDESGRVVGVLDIYDVLADDEDTPPAEHLTEPLLLPETMTVTDALYQMQRAHRMMAIVRAGGDVPVGVVTIKDLVEEIVGELEAW